MLLAGGKVVRLTERLWVRRPIYLLAGSGPHHERETTVSDDHRFESADGTGANENAPTTALMVIRTWHETGQPLGFRARVTFGQSPERSETTMSTTDPAEVLGVVKRWLAVQAGTSGSS